MSLEAVTIALNHSKAVGTAKLVMIGLANHYGPDSSFGAYPSQARLAKYANTSTRAVREALTKLIDLGELRVEVNAGVGPEGRQTNRYFILLRCPDNCDRTMNHGTVEAERHRVEAERQEGGSLASEGWKDASTKPYLNRNTTIISDDDFEKPKNATRLSEDWWPDDDGWQAMRQKYPHLDLTTITESFKDYWISLPGTKARKLDWLRTWQGRVREVAGRSNGYKPKRQEINLWDMTAENE